MTVNQVDVIKKLQTLKEMYVAFSGVTRMPFVTCDEETFNDQVWIFTEQDKLKAFAKSYEDKKIIIAGVKVMNEQAPMFYMNLFSIGVNEVVFQDGEEQHKLELTSIVQLPDYEKLPEEKRPVFNPELQLTAIYFLQELRRPGVEPNKALLKEMEEEMSSNLVKSTFLMPVDVVKEEDGSNNIRILYVQNKEGKKFQLIFSDTGELLKHFQGKDKKHQLLKMKCEQLPASLIKEMDGYVLNPEGINLILRKEQIELLLKFFHREPTENKE